MLGTFHTLKFPYFIYVVKFRVTSIKGLYQIKYRRLHTTAFAFYNLAKMCVCVIVMEEEIFDYMHI